MEVLIVSKTHMSTMVCVGGLLLHNNRYVRLLNPGNYNQPADTKFEVGDVWDLNFTDRPTLLPPHIEDVIITNKTFVCRIEDISAFLKQRNIIDWNGHIDHLYGGLLHWTGSGTGYIARDMQIPTQSVGFWIADHDLVRVIFDTKVKYRYPNGGTYRSVTYVGCQETIATIPAGTILRVSLSRLFPPENSEITVPHGYYLQLSGWYERGEQNIQPNRQTRVDLEDLPF